MLVMYPSTSHMLWNTSLTTLELFRFPSYCSLVLINQKMTHDVALAQKIVQLGILTTHLARFQKFSVTFGQRMKERRGRLSSLQVLRIFHFIFISVWLISILDKDLWNGCMKADYCTISTDCSRGVTGDRREQYCAGFKLSCDPWQTQKLFRETEVHEWIYDVSTCPATQPLHCLIQFCKYKIKCSIMSEVHAFYDFTQVFQL